MNGMSEGSANRMPIRHLATSPTGFLAAAGESEQNVHVWDLAGKKCVRTLETILDFGGSRLAISSDGQHVVAGSYKHHRVTCYSVEHGTQVWERTDLNKPQMIHFSKDDACIIVGADDERCRIIEAKTGRTLADVRGAQDMIESRWEPVVFISAKAIELRTTAQELIAAIPRTTFAELDVAFAHHCIVISESGGPIRCCDTTTGREIWRHFEKGRHALHLGYAPSTETIMAVDWAYERGGTRRLIHVDVSTGHRKIVAEVEPGEAAFCLEGTRLLIANGAMLDTQTGTTLGKLWASRDRQQDDQEGKNTKASE